MVEKSILIKVKREFIIGMIPQESKIYGVLNNFCLGNKNYKK